MQSARGRFVTVTLLSSALILIAGCQDQAAKAELEKFRAQTTLQEQNKAVVQKLIDGLNKQDTAYSQLYAANAEFYIPSTVAKPTNASDDLKASQANWKAFPDLHFTIEEMVAEGDRVVARLKITGTQKAAYAGIPSKGKAVSIGDFASFRLANGKIVEQREEFDALGLFTQLGMELKPGSGK